MLIAHHRNILPSVSPRLRGSFRTSRQIAAVSRCRGSKSNKGTENGAPLFIFDYTAEAARFHISTVRLPPTRSSFAIITLNGLPRIVSVDFNASPSVTKSIVSVDNQRSEVATVGDCNTISGPRRLRGYIPSGAGKS